MNSVTNNAYAQNYKLSILEPAKSKGFWVYDFPSLWEGLGRA